MTFVCTKRLSHVFCVNRQHKNVYMKKRVCLLICSVAAAVVLFSGCGGSNLDKYRGSISDYRFAALRVADDRYTLDVISGVRETPYVLDGVSATDKTDYTVFTLKPRGDYASGAETVSLVATIGGTRYDLLLAAHPFKGTFSAEVGAALGESECAELAMSLNGEDVAATACAPDAISGEYALTIALDAAADSLKGRKEYEIYLRLTENTITAAGGWYWYASFADADESVSVLMNASDGEIAAFRN